jgi:predicted lipoprotein
VSGATVVTPYISDKTLSFDEVEARFKSPIAHGRNIVYIEKDASVNYIEKVMKIATESRYIGLFRNYEPSVSYLKIL